MKKVALVYDRVNKWGGAERLLLALHRIFPQAPLFTSVYLSSRANWAAGWTVKTSFLQKLAFLRQHHQKIPFLMPFAFESFDFRGFDAVISITSAEAKGIITPPNVFHLCYCLTPTRYLYSHRQEYLRATKLPGVAKKVLDRLEAWDQVACHRPDRYVAISQAVQKRIKKYYQQEAKVIYPPLLKLKTKNKGPKAKDKNGYYLVVARLEPYKKVDLAIQAFNQLGWPLKIVGVGSQMKKLKKMAKNNIQFAGRLTDDQLFYYYDDCRALVMPQEEDFGLVSLEAQNFAKPVVAYSRGGAGETVVDGKTGVLFDKQQKSDLIKALKKLAARNFNKKEFEKNLARFSFDNFKREFSGFLQQEWQNYQMKK